jgi:hypothetical protein
MGKRAKCEVKNDVADPGDFTGIEGKYCGNRGDLGERAGH